MKYAKILTILFTVILLSACNSNGETVDHENAEVTEVTGDESINNESSDIQTEKNSIEELVDLEPVPYLTRNEATVLLIDLVTGAELATYVLEEEHAWVSQVYDFDNGYFAALVGVSSEQHLFHRFLMDLDDVDWDTVLDHDYQLRFLIFDGELNLLEELPIDTSNATSYEFIHFHNMNAFVTFENGELLIYFSPNRAIVGSNYSNIQKYNIHTGELITLFEIDAYITELIKVDDERLFYVRPIDNFHDPNSIVGVEYGVINLVTGETSIHRKEFHHQQIIATGTHVLMSEQNRRWDDDNEPRNAVLRFNILTMESELLALREGDGFWAYLSLDEAHIVTINEDFSYFRKYEITSGNLLYEVAIEPMEESIVVENEDMAFSSLEVSVVPVIVPITDSSYAIYLDNVLFGFQRFHQVVIIP